MKLFYECLYMYIYAFIENKRTVSSKAVPKRKRKNDCFFFYEPWYIKICCIGTVEVGS